MSAGARRPILERCFVRFPRLFGWVGGRFMRLRPGGWLRRRAAAAAFRQANASYNRRDFDAILMRQDPQIEGTAPAELVALGLEPSYRGHVEYRRYHEDWLAVWGDFAARPQLLYDLGERILILGRMTARPSGGGATVERDYAVIYTFAPSGLAIREQLFLDHAEALAAVVSP